MDKITVTSRQVSTLLERELGIICGFEENAANHLEWIQTPGREDGLTNAASAIAYNRRLANLHLARAEAILTLVYPALAKRDEGWLDSGKLAKIAHSIRTEGIDEEVRCGLEDLT